MIFDDQIEHLARLARENARWHRLRFLATRDRYHLGQWKAYLRTALRFARLERAPEPSLRELGERMVGP